MKMTIRPPDLMSRRHPLSSFRVIPDLRTAKIGGSSRRSRRMPPANHKAMPYFFFLATLRVFFAVFFTADFAFFAFFAFLAMLPSIRCEMA
jgi:hypothetical protein